MVITPSASGSIASGAGVALISWSVLAHVESIPIFGRMVKKEKIYNWVNKNKVLTLTGTEICNFSVHGISNPLGVMMALGATVINGLAIFAWIPFRQRRKAKLEESGIIMAV
jgi:hypothetical protein